MKGVRKSVCHDFIFVPDRIIILFLKFFRMRLYPKHKHQKYIYLFSSVNERVLELTCDDKHECEEEGCTKVYTDVEQKVDSSKCCCVGHRYFEIHNRLEHS